MGVVFRAVHQVLNRTVALKLFYPKAREHGRIPSPGFASRARQSLARLEHPNVVRIYDFNECGGVPYLCMELVEGETLAQKLTRGPVPIREAAGLVQLIASAVEYAHSQNVVHRDLKPANVIIAHDGTPKITDFGLAKVLDEGRGKLTATDAVLGTPSYMAPEQAAGQTTEIGPRTDVYALGAILYELLSGAQPFVAQSKLEILALVQAGNVVPPSRHRAGVPPELEAVCLKCLAYSPSDRFPSADALVKELERWRSGERTFTRPTGFLRRLIRRAGRRRIPGRSTRCGGGGVGRCLSATVEAGQWPRTHRTHSGRNPHPGPAGRTPGRNSCSGRSTAAVQDPARKRSDQGDGRRRWHTFDQHLGVVPARIHSRSVAGANRQEQQLPVPEQVVRHEGSDPSRRSVS